MKLGRFKTCLFSWMIIACFLASLVVLFSPASAQLEEGVEGSVLFDEAVCLRDVLENLPMRDGQAFAHHWDARTGKWNEDIRFEHMDLGESPCTVMDVGGNTHARDTERLLKVYDWCMFHVYEPIPEYHASLTKYYSGDQFRKSVRIHPFGIGNTTHQMAVSKRDLAGESTFLGKNTAGTIRLYIKSMEDALAQLEVPQVSLLHMNCEGCEWEVLTSMGETGMFSRFVYIQFSAHNYGLEGVGVRGIQLCKIREYLSRTHSMHKGVPFGWERWVRRE